MLVSTLGPFAAVGVATTKIAEYLHFETKILAVAAPKATTAPYSSSDRHIYP
jgi:hypothetical protein